MELIFHVIITVLSLNPERLTSWTSNPCVPAPNGCFGGCLFALFLRLVVKQSSGMVKKFMVGASSPFFSWPAFFGDNPLIQKWCNSSICMNYTVSGSLPDKTYSIKRTVCCILITKFSSINDTDVPSKVIKVVRTSAVLICWAQWYNPNSVGLTDLPYALGLY